MEEHVHKNAKGINFSIPYELNEKLEKYMKVQELRTGKRPAKHTAIINILKEKLL